MAAIAGSKGRISPVLGRRRGPGTLHVALLKDMIDGRTSTRLTAERVVGSALLRELGIDTNMICNLDCSYCYLKSRQEQKASISAADWTDALLPTARRGVKLFSFIGKEPLADDTALEVARRLDDARLAEGLTFRTGMVTNGTLVMRQLSRIASANLSFLDISLDHVTDARNSLRGNALAGKVTDAILALDAMDTMTSRTVATVLHNGNIDGFSEHLEWIEKLTTFSLFASPILDFTGSADDIDPLSIPPSRVYQLLELIARSISSRGTQSRWTGSRQILIDLPYSYAWAGLRDGVFDVERIEEDEFEAHFVQPYAGIPLFVKLNLLPLSYWRAARITHDGHILEDMDLAAHADYKRTSRSLADIGETWFPDRPTVEGLDHFTRFFDRYWDTKAYERRIADRFVETQFHEHLNGKTTGQRSPTTQPTSLAAD